MGKRVEVREYEVIGGHSEVGRSTVVVLCPFCGATVVAYLWSLAGSGKRCVCRAKFDHSGRATAELGDVDGEVG